MESYKNKKTQEDFFYYFEILATDITGNVVIKNENNFCYNLISNNELWINPEIKKGNKIYDNENQIQLEVKKINNEEDQSEFKKAFSITVRSKRFDSLEPQRILLLKYLKNLNFDLLYVLEDDISSKIASQLYPSIYKVESFLRKYVIKFFALKLGPEWWKLTAGSDMQKKTNLRKNNETIFSEYIDNEVYLIDFGELGKLIHSQSSGNLNKEDIVSKIIELEESVGALLSFKKEIQTNYNKFFKKTFKENNFQQQWEELEKIRHKVAHNNLFTIDDQDTGSELIKNLIETIKKANEEIDKITFNDQEKEHIMSSFLKFEKITRDVLLNELKRSIEWSKKADNFVGLQNFIINILGSMGYSFEDSKYLIKELEEENILEIYIYTSDKTEHGVAAIRLIK